MRSLIGVAIAHLATAYRHGSVPLCCGIFAIRSPHPVLPHSHRPRYSDKRSTVRATCRHDALLCTTSERLPNTTHEARGRPNTGSDAENSMTSVCLLAFAQDTLAQQGNPGSHPIPRNSPSQFLSTHANCVNLRPAAPPIEHLHVGSPSRSRLHSHSQMMLFVATGANVGPGITIKTSPQQITMHDNCAATYIVKPPCPFLLFAAQPHSSTD